MEQKQMQHSDLLSGLQQIINSWKMQFDTPPALKIDFTINDANMLCVNDTVLCPADSIENAESLVAEWDMFFLKTNTGDAFDIIINWPFSGPPEITRIMKSRDIYVRGEAS